MACTQFEFDRIAVIKARIEATETAISAITVGGAEEYSINTGQTIRKVTKLDIDKLRKGIEADMNSLNTLEIRCGVRNPNKTIVPGF